MNNEPRYVLTAVVSTTLLLLAGCGLLRQSGASPRFEVVSLKAVNSADGGSTFLSPRRHLQRTWTIAGISDLVCVWRPHLHDFGRTELDEG
jgi:hypothetical protein